jgi:hypothetical protein
MQRQTRGSRKTRLNGHVLEQRQQEMARGMDAVLGGRGVYPAPGGTARAVRWICPDDPEHPPYRTSPFTRGKNRDRLPALPEPPSLPRGSAGRRLLS